MELSYELISEFAKVVTGKKKTNSESTVYGTVVADSKGNKYVKLDGSDQLTPLSDDERPAVDSTSANANEGERVSVLIKNHTAVVTGNISSPAARTGDVEDLGDQVTKIQEFDILVGEQLQAQEGYIKKLQTDKANVGELNAAVAKIEELEANSITTEDLKAERAEIDDILADKIDAAVVDAKYATIDSLNTTNANISNLNSDYITFKEATGGKITASDGRIDNLETEMFDAETGNIKFANIDFANITEAAFTKLFAESGMIDNLVVGDGSFVGDLVAVTVSGDLIKANTLKADQIVVRGSDGNYYKLNTDFSGLEGVTPVEDDSIHGSAIVANSITAQQINVKELAAFEATIGGFNIIGNDTDAGVVGALYSGAKAGVSASAPGIYLGQDGQVSIGGTDDYIKFYKLLDADGNEILNDAGEPIYRLAISAESILFGSDSKASLADVKELTEHVKIGRRPDPDNIDPETGEPELVPYVELSEGDTNFKQVITNMKTQFMDGDVVKTEIDTEGVKTDNLEVEREFRQKGFVWSVRSNGNLGLSWKGGNN